MRSAMNYKEWYIPFADIFQTIFHFQHESSLSTEISFPFMQLVAVASWRRLNTFFDISS